uniref:Glycoprotein hormone subunit beta domain-containing protein n=1 Tax=Hucho hucho TaxID=62062 RepID=A0A4W5KT09_9TELE
RMCLAIMATLWMTPVRAGTDCRYGCRLNNMTITLEGEDCYGSISITTCAGLCETTVNAYKALHSPPFAYLEGCPPRTNRVDIPVAKSCDCIKCKTDNTNCDRISMATPSCVVNPLET